MEKQDIPKSKKFIEDITNSSGFVFNCFYGLIVFFCFITSIALSYEYGLIGWSIIGFKLLKVFMIVGVLYFIMFICKIIVYKSNEAIEKVHLKNQERKNNFKKQLKKEILKEMKDGRNSKRR